MASSSLTAWGFRLSAGRYRRRHRRRPWSRDRPPARAKDRLILGADVGIFLGLPLLLEDLDRGDLVAAPDQPSLDRPVLGLTDDIRMPARPRSGEPRPRRPATARQAASAASVRNGPRPPTTSGGTDDRPHGVTPREDLVHEVGLTIRDRPNDPEANAARAVRVDGPPRFLTISVRPTRLLTLVGSIVKSLVVVSLALMFTASPDDGVT